MTVALRAPSVSVCPVGHFRAHLCKVLVGLLVRASLLLLYFLFVLKSLLASLWAGVYCSVLTSVMFVALYRVLINEEDPCDGVGPDDLSLEALSMHVNVMKLRA